MKISPLALTLLPLAAAMPAPMSPPFVHPRGFESPPTTCVGAVIDITDYGASPDATPLENQAAINKALGALAPCDTLIIPADHTFPVVGGIYAAGLLNNTILFDGTLEFQYDEVDWPTDPNNKDKFKHCIQFEESMDLAISSSLPSGAQGTINGNGRIWWDMMIAGTLPGGGDSRPRMFEVSNCADVLIERIHLVNSPSWNLVVSAARAEIRDVFVETDRDYSDSNLYSSWKDTLKEWIVDELSGLIPDKLLQVSP